MINRDEYLTLKELQKYFIAGYNTMIIIASRPEVSRFFERVKLKSGKGGNNKSYVIKIKDLYYMFDNLPEHLKPCLKEEYRSLSNGLAGNS